MRFLIKTVGIVVGLAIGVYLASLVYVVSFGIHRNIPQHADAILVLGAKVNIDNTPSPTLYNRSITAADLYNQGKANYIITTGGIGLGAAPESKVSEKIVEQHSKVPKDKVIKETQSHNTFENVNDVRKLAQDKNIKSVIVVSDRFHVARAVLVAKYFGFSPVYWDFPDENYYKPRELAWYYVREAAALIAYAPRLLLAGYT